MLELRNPADLQKPVYGQQRAIYILLIVNYLENLTVEDAKIFWSGRSQAVRLPKEFRLDTDEVRIWRDGSGLILESIARDRAWLDEIIGLLDDDFIAPRDAEHCGTSQYGLNHQS